MLAPTIHAARRPHVPPRGSAACLCAPAITCLPFLDFCTLWLLQDPMRPHSPAATAPSHKGWSREREQLSQEEQPLLGTVRNSRAEPSRHKLSPRREAWRAQSGQTMVPHRRTTLGKPHRQSLNCQPLQQSKTKDQLITLQTTETHFIIAGEGA